MLQYKKHAWRERTCPIAKRAAHIAARRTNSAASVARRWIGRRNRRAEHLPPATEPDDPAESRAPEPGPDAGLGSETSTEEEWTQTPPARKQKSGLATAGLVLGVLALAVCSLSPIALLLSLPFSLIGLAFSAIARGQDGRGAALGIILNIAALTASVLLFMRCAFVVTERLQEIGWEMRYLLDTQFGHTPGATPTLPIEPGTPL